MHRQPEFQVVMAKVLHPTQINLHLVFKWLTSLFQISVHYDGAKVSTYTKNKHIKCKILQEMDKW